MTCIDCELIRLGREARPGEPLTLPPGILVHAMDPHLPDVYPLRKRQSITPRFVDRYSDGKVIITWAGTGGYWKRITARDGRAETLASR